MNNPLTSLDFQRAFASASVTGTGNSSLIVDTFGFMGTVTFVTTIAAVSAADGSNYLVLSVYESNDDDFSDATETVIPANRTIGTGYTINATSQANSIIAFGVTIGLKRYMRITMTETGTFSATFGIAAILSGPREAPVSN